MLHRPLEPLQPGFLPGLPTASRRGEISGLTRFDNNTQRPIRDQRITRNLDRRITLELYLRSTRHWHNGDEAKAAHLHQPLSMLSQLPALDRSFISVKRIEVTHPQR
ncbi:hypothetical protein ACNKHX_02380 [Shigella flexneri]